MSSIREALKGSDIEVIRTGMTALVETLQRVSTAAYQASAAEAGSSDGTGDESEGGGEGAPPSGEAREAAPEGEEAVEGEFKEV